MYAKVFQTAERVLADIYKVIGVAAGQPSNMAQGAAINTIPWPHKELVALPNGECAVATGSGPLLPLELVSAHVSTLDEPAVSVKETKAGVFVMANTDLRVTIEDGVITSLYDNVGQREVIAAGKKANQYVIFDDKPLYWQAWDVEVFHLDTRQELSNTATHISEVTPYRVSVVTETRISEQSSIRTTISLAAALEGEPSIVEVSCDVDWHETMRFLKVEFPVAVRNTEASYETQFGVLRRPTHYNTSWDMAKFEVCSHKYADLSEHGYGVSILNDSKYGFATAGSLMRLSLLRAPKAPDAHADMGQHSMRWAIMPHVGILGPSTVRKAYQFNNPKVLVQAAPGVVQAAAGAKAQPVTLTGDKSLVLDTVKRAEDDADVRAQTAKDADGPLLRRPRNSRSVVLRIYDSLGGRSRGTVTVGSDWPVAKVYKANLLEDDLEQVSVSKDNSFAIDLGPFEVATYRVELE